MVSILSAENKPRKTSEFVTLGLGKFQFSIRKATYESIKTQYEFSWSSIPRIGVLPALQFTGENNPTLTIQAQIATVITGNKGLLLVDDLLLEARKKKPLEMVDSEGVSLGQWVIVGIERDDSAFVSDRKTIEPRRIGVNLSLKFFGD